MQFLTLGLVLLYMCISTCMCAVYVHIYAEMGGCMFVQCAMRVELNVGTAVWGETAKEGAVLNAGQGCIFRGDFIDSTEGNGQIEPRAGSGTEWGTSTYVCTLHSNLLYSARQQYISCDATPMGTAVVCLPHTSMHSASVLLCPVLERSPEGEQGTREAGQN